MNYKKLAGLVALALGGFHLLQTTISLNILNQNDLNALAETRVSVGYGTSDTEPSKATMSDSTVASISKYEVKIPLTSYVAYTGTSSASFPNGFPAGVGSGLRFKSKNVDGTLSFYVLTDRGPNSDGPKYKASNGSISSTKVFPSPTFSPFFGLLTVTPELSAELGTTTMLKANNIGISGRPIAPGKTGSTKEVLLGEDFSILTYDDNGLDPEGIDVDSHGNIWICDEYGPFIAQIDPATGNISKKYSPGSELPSLLSSRQANRGFEGIAITPSDKIYAVVQSTLDINSETKDTAQFIRIVELDPTTNTTRMFAYPHDVSSYAKSGDAKIGDLVAIDDLRFLLVEQGKDKHKKLRNIVYVLDISGATDLTDKTLTSGTNAGKELEYGIASDLANITMVKKAKLFDLRDYGWLPEKAEGLALIDSQTIAVINDNDFGLTAKMSEASRTDPTNYIVDANQTLTTGSGVATTASYMLEQSDQNELSQRLWVFNLAQPLSSFYP